MRRCLPIVRSLPTYDRRVLGFDVTAGATVYVTATCTTPAIRRSADAGGHTRNPPFVIEALVDLPTADAQGVLFAFGTRFGGHALYVKGYQLHYVNSFVGAEQQIIVGSEDIPTGENILLSESFEKEGMEPTGATGTLSLYHGETPNHSLSAIAVHAASTLEQVIPAGQVPIAGSRVTVICDEVVTSIGETRGPITASDRC